MAWRLLIYTQVCQTVAGAMFKNRIFDQPSSSLDMKSLSKLREASLDKDKKQAALHQAAQQLESVFMNMMMKSMRQANEVFSEGSMMESQEGTMFRDMLDQQYASSLSNRSGFGLAEQIERQLDPLSGRISHHSEKENEKNDGGLFDLPGRQKFTLPQISRDNFSLLTKPETTGVDSSSPESFVNSILPHAEKAGKALGIDPRAIIAQAALETGWGKHIIEDRTGKSSLNLFGIKAGEDWKGGKATVETTEYRQNVAVREVANFRSYENLERTFDDYVSFLKSHPRYANALKSSQNAAEWGTHLQQAGYATDPNYGKKIAKLVMSNEISGATKA